jgi:hypothetical protein
VGAVEKMLTLDLDRLRGDLDAAKRRVEETQAAVDAANQNHAEATREYDRLRDFIHSVNAYLVPADEALASEVSSARQVHSGTGGIDLPQPLGGLGALQAARSFVELNSGRQMKLSAIGAEMRRLGYGGTLNALSVAFSDLSRLGVVTRVRKGHYLFSTPGDATGDASLTDVANDDPPEPEREQSSIFQVLPRAETG